MLCGSSSGAPLNGSKVSTLPVAYLDNITLVDNTVNKAPVFTGGADQSVLQSAGPQTIAGWAQSISAFETERSSCFASLE